jgi:hypothetical protein
VVFLVVAGAFFAFTVGDCFGFAADVLPVLDVVPLDFGAVTPDEDMDDAGAEGTFFLEMEGFGAMGGLTRTLMGRAAVRGCDIPAGRGKAVICETVIQMPNVSAANATERAAKKDRSPQTGLIISILSPGISVYIPRSSEVRT